MSEQLWLPSWLATISITFSLAVVWVVRRANKKKVPVSNALDVAMVMMVAAFLGGRLAHIFFEQPRFYFENPQIALMFWQGGFVYFGGLALALGAGGFLCYRRKLDYLVYGNLFAPIFAFTYALGRLGCFLNGCCYGKSCDLPWAVEFYQHALYSIDVIPRHPTQLYALFGELLILGLLLFLDKRKQNYPLFLIWVSLHGLNRYTMELFRDDFRGPIILGQTLGQWISLLMFVIGTLTLIRLKMRSRLSFERF